LQVGQKTTLGLNVGVRDLVSSDGNLSGYLTDASHNESIFGRAKVREINQLDAGNGIFSVQELNYSFFTTRRRGCQFPVFE
jgi:hypothetical protein